MLEVYSHRMYRFLLIVPIIALTGCSVLQSEARYEVTGSGMAKVSWLSGGTQSGDETLPFTATATAPRGVPSQFYVSAIGSEETGELTCSLYIDDVLVSTQSASGVLPVVTCSG